ncbi:MAG: hypothetical protein PW786_13250 [Arachidicoccus sp.]|nr:hypothetical protein [Arachidicoccus sp.]
MASKKNNTNERQLKFSRLLDAPVELVWEVWTNPEYLGRYKTKRRKIVKVFITFKQ